MIEPIELLVGSHTDTGTTGHGCFMNVVAYLNGDSQITDKSECVCFAMRPLVIYANDLFYYTDRQKLLPFVMRAIGSRTDDKAEVMRRLALIVEFADKQNKFACDNAKRVANYDEHTSCARCAAELARFATEHAVSGGYAQYAEYAADCAATTANYAAKRTTNRAEWYAMTRDDLITLFDNCFPQITEPQQAHIDRAKHLHELAHALEGDQQ